jgi:hypothetical protein
MVRLHMKLGGWDKRGRENEDHRFRPRDDRAPGWSIVQGGRRGDKDESRQFGSIHLHPLHSDEGRDAKTFETLDNVVKPLQTRFQHAITMMHPRATTIVAKTKLAIGALSFSPNEVLALNLDGASIARAESLGFVRIGGGVPEGNSRITRFQVPPGLDSVRGQDLLNKEMPKYRFELNKVYRIYRAAMREEPGAPKQTQPVSPALPSCPSEHCAPRKIIQWQDNFSACARGLRVGVIDTEIDIGHPAFKGRHVHRDSFAPDNLPAAPDWHGTGVLSILAGDESSGTPGLIPDAEFFTASIFFSEENGGMATDTISLLKALNWMQANDVKLINMSFSGPRDELVHDEIEQIASRGVVFVAAAGNEGPTAEPSYPAAYPEVIAVTAVTSSLHNYRYANRGDHIDVAAPGVDVWAAVPGAREGYHSGTSFAAPYVTGILAVLPREDFKLGKDPLLEGLPVVDLGATGRDPVYGRGLLLAPPACIPPVDTIASAER